MTKTHQRVTAAADDVIEINRTSSGVTVTSSNDSDKSQSQNIDNYSVWTARINEANTLLCLIVVITHREMHACDWSKSRHVNYC